MMLASTAVWLTRFQKAEVQTMGSASSPPRRGKIELLSYKDTMDSSDSQTAMIPNRTLGFTSSQLWEVLNCQPFTQVITVAVILCKYSR